MNHIYKVIFCKATNTFVAVPEYAKGATKTASSKSTQSQHQSATHSFKLRALCLALLAGMAGTSAYAATECTAARGTSPFTGAFNCGPGTSVATEGSRSDKPEVAIGSTAKATGGQAVAIGSLVTASGINSTAVGNDSIAAGRGSVAFGGDDAGADNKVVPLGYGYYDGAVSRLYRQTLSLGQGSTAVGSRAQALTEDSLAFGNGATAGKVKGTSDSSSTLNVSAYEGGSTTALGANSWAQAEKSVAVGALSKAKRALFEGDVTSSEEKITTADASTNANKVYAFGDDNSDVLATVKKDSKGNYLGEFAVGNENQTRQITGVAAGALDTDAVNVAQLRGVAERTVKYYSVNDDVAGSLGDDNDKNKSNKGAYGANALAAGIEASAKSTNSAAIGFKANVGENSDRSLALGTAAKVLDGSNGSMAIGYGANVKGNNSVAQGTSASVEGVNSVAVGNEASAQKSNAVAVGFRSSVKGGNGVAIGSQSVAATDESVALGLRATATGAQATALGNDALAHGDASISNGGNRSAVNGKNLKYSQPIYEDADPLTFNTTDQQANWEANKDKFRGLIGPDDLSSGQYFRRNVAAGSNSQAYGTHSQALAEGAIAMGLTATAGDAESYEFGRNRTDGLNEFTSKSGEHSVAIGTLSFAQKDGSLALGEESLSEVDDAVAVGSHSKAKRALFGSTVTASDEKIEATDAKTNTNKVYAVGDAADVLATVKKDSDNKYLGEFSVGNENQTRQITNVAAGALDTDAVNVAQLRSVSKAAKEAETHYYSVKSTDQGADSNYNNDGAKGSHSLAAGVNALAKGDSSIAVGDTAKTYTNDAIVIGRGAKNGEDTGTKEANGRPGDIVIGAEASSLVLGKRNHPDELPNTVIGYKAAARTASTGGGVAIGTEANVHAHGSVAIGQRAKATYKDYDPNAAQLPTKVQRGSIAIGMDSLASYDGSTAGDGSLTPIAIGAISKATADGAIAIGEGALSGVKRAVAIGSNSKTAEAVATESFEIDGITYDNLAGTAPVATVSIGNNEQKRTLTNVAAGRVSSTSTDAINGSQLFAVANKPLTFVGNSGTTEQKLGSTLNIKGGATEASSNSNVKTVVTENNIDIQLLDAPTFAGKVSAQGLDAGSQKITNIADGEDDNDAVNKSQLDAAAKAAKTEVKAGNNVTVEDNTATKAETDPTIYTVNAKKSTVSNGSDAVTVNPGTETNDTTDYVVDLSDATKNDIAVAKNAIENKGLTFTGDSGTTGIKKLGESVAVTGGDNITTEASDSGITVKLDKKLTGLTSVAVTNGPTINASGIDMGSTPSSPKKITNLAPGTANGDAVNFEQLNAQKTHYYSVKSTEQRSGSNYNNDGAQGDNSLAAGVRAKATGDNSIAVGSGATAYDPNALAIGKRAYVDSYGDNSSDGIAIGNNARSVQGGVRTDKSIFGFTIPNSPEVNNYIPGSTKGIAIGKDTYANESTVDIGAKSVNNQTKGASRRGVTSVGADSFAAAHFSTITGSYSTIETKPDQRLSRGFSSQGFASTINGSLNTITANGETGEAVKYDGIANAITGTANVIEHSNGALIMGAGNKISNSRKELVLRDIPTFSNITNPNKLNEILNKRDAEGKKPELGSVGVFGGGNEVDRAYYSNIQGVDNALKGTDDTASQFVSIEGYRNQAENVEHLVTSGSFNKITNAEENIVMGNYNELTGENTDRSQAKRNVILGFQDKDANQIGKNISNNQIIGSNVTVAEGTTKGVLLGDDAKVEGNGAVALGAESVADRAALTGVAASDKAKSADNQVYALEIATDDDKQAIVDTVKGDLAAVSVGSADKTRQITNVAAGSDDTDAVNVSQLKAVANVASSPLTFVGDDGTKVERKLGSTLNITGGEDETKLTDKNIGVVADGDDTLKVKLAKNLTGLESISLGEDPNQTVINNEGITINKDGKDPVSLTAGGLDNGNNKITNVAAGTAGTDAVNKDQLDAVSKTASNANKGWEVNTDKTGTGKVEGSASTKVAPGEEVKYIAGDNIKLTQNGKNITVAADNVVAYDSDDKDTVTLGGTTLTASKDADGNINTTGGTSLKNVASAGDYTDVANAGNAVNAGDLNNAVVDVTDALTEKGLKFKGNAGEEFTTKLGDTVNIKGGMADDTAEDKTSGENVITRKNAKGDGLVIELAKDAKFDSITAGNSVLDNSGVTIDNGKDPAVTLTKDGLNNGGNKITNVAAGTDDTDAVNKAQLDAVSKTASNANQGWKVNTGQTGTGKVEGSAPTKVAPGEEVKYIAGDNIKLTQDGKNITVAADNVVAYDSDKKDTVTLGGTGADPVTVTNVKDGKVAEDSKDAVNGSQLFAVKDQVDTNTTQIGTNATNINTNSTNINTNANNIAANTTQLNKGLDFAGNEGEFNRKLGDKVTIKGGLDKETAASSSNIRTKAGAGEIEILLADAPNFEGKVTAKGVDASGEKITNVAAGKADTDAVNVKQLNDKVAEINKGTVAAKTEVIAGKNVEVTSTTGDNDQTIYTVETKEDVDFTSATVGGVSIKDGGITNVKAGDVSKDSTDVINGSQLFNQGEGVKNIIGGDTKYDPSTGTYTNSNIGGTGENTIDDAIKAINTEAGVKTTVSAGKNITVEKKGNDYKVATSDKVSFDSVTADDGKGNSTVLNAGGTTVTDKDGNKAQYDASGITITPADSKKSPVSVTANGLNNGGNVITNVADGRVAIGSTDAVNGGQLAAVDNKLTNAINDLGYRVDDVADQANAGISSAMAMASLPQAYLPGKSMISGGIATYNGEGAVAVGISKLSDNGRWVFKMNGSADTEGNAGAAAGIGMHW